MTPKPAYERLHDLIKGKWWTKAEARTGAGATVPFEGFLGSYEVEAEQGDRRLTGRFVLDKGQEAAIDVQLA